MSFVGRLLANSSNPTPDQPLSLAACTTPPASDPQGLMLSMPVPGAVGAAAGGFVRAGAGPYGFAYPWTAHATPPLQPNPPHLQPRPPAFPPRSPSAWRPAANMTWPGAGQHPMPPAGYPSSLHDYWARGLHTTGALSAYAPPTMPWLPPSPGQRLPPPPPFPSPTAFVPPPPHPPPLTPHRVQVHAAAAPMLAHLPPHLQPEPKHGVPPQQAVPPPPPPPPRQPGTSPAPPPRPSKRPHRPLLPDAPPPVRALQPGVPLTSPTELELLRDQLVAQQDVNRRLLDLLANDKEKTSPSSRPTKRARTSPQQPTPPRGHSATSTQARAASSPAGVVARHTRVMQSPDPTKRAGTAPPNPAARPQLDAPAHRPARPAPMLPKQQLAGPAPSSTSLPEAALPRRDRQPRRGASATGVGSRAESGTRVVGTTGTSRGSGAVPGGARCPRVGDAVTGGGAGGACGSAVTEGPTVGGGTTGGTGGTGGTACGGTVAGSRVAPGQKTVAAGPSAVLGSAAASSPCDGIPPTQPVRPESPSNTDCAPPLFARQGWAALPQGQRTTLTRLLAARSTEHSVINSLRNDGQLLAVDVLAAGNALLAPPENRASWAMVCTRLAAVLWQHKAWFESNS